MHCIHFVERTEDSLNSIERSSDIKVDDSDSLTTATSKKSSIQLQKKLTKVVYPTLYTQHCRSIMNEYHVIPFQMLISFPAGLPLSKIPQEYKVVSLLLSSLCVIFACTQ